MIIMLINKLYIILRVHFDSGDMLSIIIIYVYIYTAIRKIYGYNYGMIHKFSRKGLYMQRKLNLLPCIMNNYL